jgi:hypothetical protein
MAVGRLYILYIINVNEMDKYSGKLWEYYGIKMGCNGISLDSCHQII